MKPGDLVEILHPGIKSPALALIIEKCRSGLFRVLMMNEESRGKIFRFSESILKVVSE